MPGATLNWEQRKEGEKAFDLVHTHVLSLFSELIEELGGEPGQLLEAAGIGTQGDTGAPVEVRYGQWSKVLECAARQLECPDIGMRLAQRQGGTEAYGPLGAVMRNSRCLGDGLAYVASHSYAHSLASRIELRKLGLGSEVFVGYELLVERDPPPVQVLEQMFLLGHLGALEVTGGHARVRRIHFRHQPVASPAVYARYFGCEVRFGQDEDGVVFLKDDLACPTRNSDAQVLAEATLHIERDFENQNPPLFAAARGAIFRHLIAGDCSNERVAADLGLGTRTLHRRLAAQGISFQKLKDDVRRETLRYYLEQTTFSLAWIADRLGFADQAAMARSCRRWFASSPSAMRAERSQAGQSR